MKNFLTLILLLIATIVSAQYPYKINIEPNLSKDIKYAQMSENNVPRPTGRRYANKGEYKSVTADVFKEEFLNLPVLQSGIYDPILSDSANISDLSAASYFHYLRVGDVFTISGSVNIDAIQDTISTYFHFSLPPDFDGYEIEADEAHGVSVSANSGTLSQCGYAESDNGIGQILYHPKLGSTSTSIHMQFTLTGNLIPEE